VKQELIEAVESSPFSGLQACKVLGLSAERFYHWRTRESLVDKPPIAKLAPHKLLAEEREDIVSYSLDYPEQRHRELWYNLAREGKVHVSPSSVYRVLKSEDLVPPHVFGKPHREKVKPDPTGPHQDWMIDITYIPIQAVDWYLIVLLDVYSRYIVGWELSSSMTCMTWREIQGVVDFAMEDWGLRWRIGDYGIHWRSHVFTMITGAN